MDPLLVAILCLLLAGALAAIDLFVPSGGVLAISSLLAGTASVFFAFRSGSTAGLMMLCVILIAIPIFITVALRVWPYTPVGRRIILRTPSAPVPPTAPPSEFEELIGKVGVTQSALMPFGYVRIEGRNYNAVTESGVIDPGSNVQVLSIQQRNLVVAITSLSPSVRLETPLKSEPTTPPLGESLLDRPAEDLGLDSLE